MAKIEYFRGTNRLNSLANLLSGNILPLCDERIELSYVSLVWVTFVWVVRSTYFLTVLAGSFYFANLTTKEAFKKSGAAIAVFFELIIPTIYLNVRRKDLRELVRKYNQTLIDSEDLRKMVCDTVEPYRKGLQLYVIVCLITASSWSAAPIFITFKNDRFTYADYAAPAYLPGEPFTVNVFRAGVALQILGGSFTSFGKISIDVYVTHFIAVSSAEYKYVGAQLSDALRQEDDETALVNALRTCVRHHGAIIKIGRKLSDLLALHIGTTYVSCIMKLCFLGYGVITFESAPVEKAAYMVYAAACIFQLFLLCSCIQELLDVSTSVTHDAFHENWHARSTLVKKMFYTMEMSNAMECRLSAYRVVDLVVPSLAQILSKSYSVCLLLLEVN
ncbi:putative odorant receptor 92a [Venturia canescens]|uniref:putative odorant receptor 92a n=1 Tax=Venturia canescens TaxID=32260 RepID=UPI001C9BCB4D|nr:putative odorant receptor 92a [Venturia canescens]